MLGEGWVGEEALAIAVHCALTPADFRSGVLHAVNHGGDSDSTGAICGNLLGASLGAEAIDGDLLARARRTRRHHPGRRRPARRVRRRPAQTAGATPPRRKNTISRHNERIASGRPPPGSLLGACLPARRADKASSPPGRACGTGTRSCGAPWWSGQMSFVTPSDADYLRAKQIKQGQSHLDPVYDGFVERFRRAIWRSRCWQSPSTHSIGREDRA